MKIAVYCNNLIQLDFFCRFIPVFKTNGIQFVFLSNRLSVVMKARRIGQMARLLSQYHTGCYDRRVVESGLEKETRWDLFDSMISPQLIQKTKNAALSFFDQFKPDLFWLWNGSNFVRQSLVAVGQEIGVPTLFFEIGNFPGKLFVDPEGVNSRSWYARHRNDLRELVIDWGKFNEWKESYIAAKQKHHSVPQARMVENFNLNFSIDLIGFYFLGAILSEPPRPIWRTVDFIQRRICKFPLDTFDPERCPGYIFFPLQVSTDSQVLFNSTISQCDAIQRASEMAHCENKILVVKPHPAEPHWSAIQEVLKLKESFGFKLVGSNTFTLIKYCSRVVTLNSTVGLEAMIFAKPVQVLGNAHYEGFDDLDLATYLQNYLLDIDFFSSEPISQGQLDQIMLRVKH